MMGVGVTSAVQSSVETSAVGINRGRSGVGARKRRQRKDGDEKIFYTQICVCVRWEERRKCLTIMMIRGGLSESYGMYMMQ